MSPFDAVDGSSTGTEVPSMWALLRLPRFGGANHADGHDNRPRHRKVGFSNHNVIVCRKLKLRYVLPFFQKLPPCVVGIEACASSHHWSRELQALGHTVRLMPPAYVKPYVVTSAKSSL
jgi:transposase